MALETSPPDTDRIEAELAERHAQRAELHQRQQDLHRKLKTRQRTIMARIVGFGRSDESVG